MPLYTQQIFKKKPYAGKYVMFKISFPYPISSPFQEF